MKHLIENTFLLIMITVGGLGMAFSFVSNETIESHKHQVITTSHETTASKTSDYSWDPFLKVRGIKEAGAQMSFEVNAFNSNAHYTLDFGNGEKKHLSRKKQQYTYRSAGDYNLRLFITYNGKTKLVHSEVINIDNQVVASANMQGAN